MAEIPGWLKPFQRIRTPLTGGSPSVEQTGHFDEANAKGNETETTRTRHLTMVSSYLNLGRHKLQEPSISSFTEATQPATAVDVWHNPDELQVVETLKVLLMNRNSFEPIPVQYNSCVLQVLEAYGSMRESLKQMERNLDHLTADRMREIRSFSERITTFEERERNYKQEIKKLEIMLATGERGLHMVTIARSKSLVYKPEIKREENLDRDNERMTVDFATERDRQVSDNFLRRISHDWSRNVGQVREQGHQRRAPGCSSTDQDKVTTHFDQPELQEAGENLNSHQNSRSGRSITYSSSSSEGDSLDGDPPGDIGDLRTHQSNPKSKSQVMDRGSSHHLPGNRSKMVSGESLETEMANSHKGQDENNPTMQGARRRGFSFVPGDDYAALSIEPGTKWGTVYGLGIYSTEDHQRLDVPNPKIKNAVAVVNNVDKLHMPNAPDSASARNGQFPSSDRRSAVTEIPDLERSHNSQSSIVTAIRDNSGRSSRNFKTVSEEGGGKLNSHSHSTQNEAIIAAVRAVAGNERKAS